LAAYFLQELAKQKAGLSKDLRERAIINKLTQIAFDIPVFSNKV